MTQYKTIADLPAASSINPQDLFELSQFGTSRKGSLQLLIDAGGIPGSPGADGPAGPPGADGAPGPAGPGVAAGGTSGQVLTKNSATNYDTIWSTPAAAATLAAGAVGYGSVGSLLTGVLANMSFDATNKRLGVGIATPAASVDIVSTVNNGPIFNAVGVANSSAAQTWFHIAVADPTGGSGSSFRIDGGTTGGLGLFDIDRTGDCNMAGWLRILQQTGPPAGGAYYYGIYLGSSTTGNLGFFGGTGAPTLDTFGAYGSLYMNKAAPGVPYYNSNGGTGWTMLAPIAACATAPPSAPVTGQLWYNSDASTGGGYLYIYYDSFWVPVSPPTSGAPVTLLETRLAELEARLAALEAP